VALGAARRLNRQPNGRVGMIEFRAGGQAFVLDYAALCGGRGSYTYPQHELVSADHPRVTVSDLSAAREFKQYFRGPSPSPKGRMVWVRSR
jgi:hypothetical protein